MFKPRARGEHACGDIAKIEPCGAFCSALWHTSGELMRRLYFRLIVPDGPLRRFRLPEDFGEERQSNQGTRVRGAGMAFLWCGLSAGCWLLAQGHITPSLSFEPVMAFDRRSDDHRLAAAFPASNWVGAADGSKPPGQAGNAGDSVAAASPLVATRRVPTLVAPAELAPPSRLLRTELPKVSYTVSVLHQGGEIGRSDTVFEVLPDDGAETDERQTGREDQEGDTRLTDDTLDRRGTKGANESNATSSVAVGSNTARPTGVGPTAVARADVRVSSTPDAPAGEPTSADPPLVAPRGAPSWGLERDPFEADFVAVKPRIPLPGQDVELPGSNARTREPATVAAPNERGGKRVLHTGGGCQAAFERSNQVVTVGKNAAGTDATSEDYAAVLARMNVATCHPPRGLSVQVCVAVSDRRSVGATVTTTPANAAVASCLARQIAGLRFPASTGADLVRTRIDVD